MVHKHIVLVHKKIKSKKINRWWDLTEEVLGVDEPSYDGCSKDFLTFGVINDPEAAACYTEDKLDL